MWYTPAALTNETTVKFKKPKSAEKRKDLIPCLIMVEGSNIGETYYISKPSVTIGRGDQTDIFLVEDGISRTHARIDLHENSYTVIDLGSTNGTFVNGEPVEQMALHDGDKLRLGEVVLKFSFQDMLDVDYQAKLRNMAMRDGLTKLFNHRYFMDALAREISFALRNRQPLALLMIDIDNFRKLNETHGHPSGDSALRSVAKKLISEVRGYDIVARYGGEEFVVLLRGTPLDNSLFLAERIRKLVQTAPVSFEEKTMNITVSMGVSALNPDQAISAEDLVKQAERFLHEAKNLGKNKVVSLRNTEG